MLYTSGLLALPSLLLPTHPLPSTEFRGPKPDRIADRMNFWSKIVIIWYLHRAPTIWVLGGCLICDHKPNPLNGRYPSIKPGLGIYKRKKENTKTRKLCTSACFRACFLARVLFCVDVFLYECVFSCVFAWTRACFLSCVFSFFLL